MTVLSATKAKWEEAYTKKRPEDYDQFIQVAGMYHSQALEALCRMIMARPLAPLKILELGTGTGLLTEKVLTNFPASRVTGIDGSGEMLALARRKLAPWMDRFQEILSSFEQYPWSQSASGCYDLIISSFALHHMDHSRYPEFFSELLRILSPGGQLLIADLVKSPSDVVQRRYEDIWVEIRVQQLREMLGISRTKDEMKAEHEKNHKEEGDNPAPLPDLMRWLEQAGFRDVDCHWKHYCLAVYGGSKAA